MRLWTNTGLYIKGGAGGLLLESGAGPSFLPLPGSVLEQVSAGNPEPGVTTVRLPELSGGRISDPHAKEVDIEVCFVCKKCRVAFPSESSLLTHQRQCFGGNLESRGAFRVVQTGYECKLCSCGAEKYKNAQELKRHTESDVHLRLLKSAGFGLPVPTASPLSHEMEDVVNQITLLAARAAQEASPVDSNSNTFCQPAEPKRARFLAPNDVPQPLTSAGH